MGSVTRCVGGGLFICFTFLHVPYSTVTLTTTGLWHRQHCWHRPAVHCWAGTTSESDSQGSLSKGPASLALIAVTAGNNSNHRR
jgi:hypothetical protein